MANRLVYYHKKLLVYYYYYNFIKSDVTTINAVV
jgi:hypothetical protein